MRAFVAILAFLISLSLPGCFEKPLLVPYDQAEYDRLPLSGTGVIEGQAFVRTEGGDVRKAAGLEVACHPVTTYSTEIYQRWIVSHGNVTGGDDRAVKYSQRTIGDADGRFRFENLPPGDYYIWSWIGWKYANSGVLSDTGGFAHCKVTVRDGQTVRAIATRND